MLSSRFCCCCCLSAAPLKQPLLMCTSQHAPPTLILHQEVPHFLSCSLCCCNQSLTHCLFHEPSNVHSPGWKKWSSASTWPNKVVPGRSGRKANVTIPCGTGIILDRSVTVDQIVVNGWLKYVPPWKLIARVKWLLSWLLTGLKVLVLMW